MGRVVLVWLDPLLNFEILRAASRSHLVKYPRRWKVGQDKETRSCRARGGTGRGEGRSAAPVKARRREIESHRVIFQSTPKTLAARYEREPDSAARLSLFLSRSPCFKIQIRNFCLNVPQIDWRRAVTPRRPFDPPTFPRTRSPLPSGISRNSRKYVSRDHAAIN